MDKKKFDKAREIDDQIDIIRELKSDMSKTGTINPELLKLLDSTTRDGIFSSINSILDKRSRELREEFYRI